MTLEDNIAFIEQEERALSAVRKGLLQSVSADRERATGLSRAVNELRAEVRAHRSALLSDSRSASPRVVREILLAEERLERLSELRLQLTSLLDHLEALSREWRELHAAMAELAGDPLSPSDHEKLGTLRRSFRTQLDNYGFRSLGDVEISIDSYLPEREGFNLTSAVSSSDTVRLIWAYLVGIFEVAQTAETHHPHFLVLDEPGQQDVEDESLAALHRGLATLDGQTIVAITRDVAAALPPEAGVTVHEFGNALLLQPT